MYSLGLKNSRKHKTCLACTDSLGHSKGVKRGTKLAYKALGVKGIPRNISYHSVNYCECVCKSVCLVLSVGDRSNSARDHIGGNYLSLLHEFRLVLYNVHKEPVVHILALELALSRVGYRLVIKSDTVVVEYIGVRLSQRRFVLSSYSEEAVYEAFVKLFSGVRSKSGIKKNIYTEVSKAVDHRIKSFIFKERREECRGGLLVSENRHRIVLEIARSTALKEDRNCLGDSVNVLLDVLRIRGSENVYSRRGDSLKVSAELRSFNAVKGLTCIPGLACNGAELGDKRTGNN